MIKKLAALAMGLMLCAGGWAGEAEVKREVETRLKTRVESVTKAGLLGLYEVILDGQVVYTDEKASAFIFEGQLVDAKSGRNLTEERKRKLSAIPFSELPLERAIKQVRGNGKRVIATFEDPNCGYCKRLAKELVGLNNATIYTFLLPILGEDSDRKSRQIWCAADRAKAWNDWMVEERAPSGKDNCDTSVLARNVEFARKWKINGTPAIVFADGERAPGALPLAAIEQKLGSMK